MTAPTRLFTETDARHIASRLYGIEGSVTALGGYDDQNFLVVSSAGQSYVLKVSRAGEREDVLDLQHRTARRLVTSGLDVAVPTPLPCLDGRITCAFDGRLVRLLSYVDGSSWSSGDTAGPQQLDGLGRLVGATGRALEGFVHPAMHRSDGWDPRNLCELRPQLAAIQDSARHALIERIMDRFHRLTGPRLEDLPQSVIHGDINNDNVLVDDRGEIVGLIDFENVSYTTFVSELGIAVAYAMIAQPDPEAAAGLVVAGCHRVRPLLSAERDVVLDMALARLAISVLSAARGRHVDPNNRHRTVNEPAAWSLLERFDDFECS